MIYYHFKKILSFVIIIKIIGADYSCNSFSSYSMNMAANHDCFYNPDINSNTPTLLQRYFGHYENHTVTTSDGYILHTFRVPKKNPRGVVILYHPLLSDSVVFISQGNESLAVMLWDQGYELWLPNTRGTFYSTSHTTLSSTHYKFWDYSFHEMGTIDHKYFIDYIIGFTNGVDLLHIGYSMGSTSSAIYASTYPEEAKKNIKAFISMAPALILGQARSPFRFLLPFKDLLFGFARMLHIGSFMQMNSVEGSIFHMMLNSRIPFMSQLMFKTFNDIAVGITYDFDPKLYPCLVSLHPRGTSMRTLDHYLQIHLTPRKFPQYDYGTKENMVRYGTPKPPLYNLTNIKVPYYLISSTDDVFTTNEDADLDYQAFSKEAKVYGRLVVNGLNHVDFMFGKSRIKKVYQPIIKLLDEITSTANKV